MQEVDVAVEKGIVPVVQLSLEGLEARVKEGAKANSKSFLSLKDLWKIILLDNRFKAKKALEEIQHDLLITHQNLA